jgi:predicted phosphoribosyltransferase
VVILDRHDGGRQLAQKLSKYANHTDVVVLALPRGGVPVAYEVARALKAPLDVLIVRKLGLPGHEELAIGAIASGGIRILNKEIIEALTVDPNVLDRVTKREMEELQRREQAYRGERPAPDIRDRTVILIDDGLATGASMLAAVHGLRTRHPARIVVAVPAASPQAVNMISPEVDEVVYGISPEPFDGVGKWYENFTQTTDDQVRTLLDDAAGV